MALGSFFSSFIFPCKHRFPGGNEKASAVTKNSACISTKNFFLKIKTDPETHEESSPQKRPVRVDLSLQMAKGPQWIRNWSQEISQILIFLNFQVLPDRKRVEVGMAWEHTWQRIKPNCLCFLLALNLTKAFQVLFGHKCSRELKLLSRYLQANNKEDSNVTSKACLS